MKLISKSNIYLQIILVVVLFFSLYGFVNAQETTNEIEKTAQDVAKEGLVPCNPKFVPGKTGSITYNEGTPNETILGYNKLDDDCGYNQLVELVNRGIKYFIYLSTFIAVGMFTYAGFMYFGSAYSGNSGKKEGAKKMFLSVLTGLFFIYTAWLIVYIIMNGLLSQEAKTDPMVNPLKPAPTTFNTLIDKNV